MRTGDAVPGVGPERSLAEGLIEMSKKGLGMSVVVDDAAACSGIFTDGDLRRALDRDSRRAQDAMREVMTSPGKRVARHASWRPKPRSSWSNTGSPRCWWSTTQGALVGALNVHDLMRAGVL